MDIIDPNEITIWQASDEGMVASHVTDLSVATSFLSAATFEPKKRVYVVRELADLELAYSQLGRLLSRIRPKREAAE